MALINFPDRQFENTISFFDFSFLTDTTSFVVTFIQQFDNYVKLTDDFLNYEPQSEQDKKVIIGTIRIYMNRNIINLHECKDYIKEGLIFC